tara:strand:- start:3630 stop:3821 length:192 start_codon:yes stop_codon:yes gene_type:complete
MGIHIYFVDKDKIQKALKEMNRTHDHLKCEVKNVVEQRDNYEVFVEHDTSYPYMQDKWERNEF